MLFVAHARYIPGMLHLRWITDIHHRVPSDDAALRSHRESILNNLEAFCTAAAADRPDMVIDTGDDIETTLDPVADERLHKEFHDYWSPVRGNSIRLAGNHDVACFQTGDLSRSFGFVSSVHIEKFRDATVICWDADPTPLRGAGRTFYTASAENLHDLALALDIAPAHKPVFLFSHIPLHALGNEEWLGPSERSNPTKSHYSNTADILTLIEERNLKIICLAGHRHVTTNLYYNDKIHLITQDRFTRNLALPNRPVSVNTSDIIVDRGAVDIHMYGAVPRTYRF